MARDALPSLPHSRYCAAGGAASSYRAYFCSSYSVSCFYSIYSISEREAIGGVRGNPRNQMKSNFNSKNTPRNRFWNELVIPRPRPQQSRDRLAKLAEWAF